MLVMELSVFNPLLWSPDREHCMDLVTMEVWETVTPIREEYRKNNPDRSFFLLPKELGHCYL